MRNPHRQTASAENPDRRRSALYQADQRRTVAEQIEWAFQVPTSPREKLVLLALARRPGAQPDHLVQPTGLTIGAIREALEDLLDNGWICRVFDGGYVTDLAAEEVTEYPMPDTALGDQLARVLARAKSA